MMNIDEAIKHLEESLADQSHDWGCEECKGEHKQLLEWLRELKDLREENKILTHECDRLIKEKGELLKKSEQIVEYKQLLKSATNVLNMFIPCDEDYNCSECIKQRQNCDYDDSFKWRYADEALKLIGDEK